MGALTAARLCDFTVQALLLLSLSTYFWSDSQIMLYWIKEDKRINTFVNHRATEILRLSEPHKWRYCPVQDNLVGVLIRSATSRLWKYGPQWPPSENSWPTWSFSPTIEMQSPQPISIHQLLNTIQTSTLLLTYLV